LTPASADFQEFGELHGRPRPCLHLPIHGLFVLAQDFGAPPPVQLAVFQIQEDGDLPRLEGVTRNRSAQDLAQQPVEAVEHHFQGDEIVRTHVLLELSADTARKISSREGRYDGFR